MQVQSFPGPGSVLCQRQPGGFSGKILIRKGDDPNSQLLWTCTVSWDVSLLCLTALSITSRQENVHPLGDLDLECCFSVSSCLSPLFLALTIPLYFEWWEKVWEQSLSVVVRLASVLCGHCPSAWEEFLRGSGLGHQRM